MRRLFMLLPWILLVAVIAIFFTWQRNQIPKPPVAADGVVMPEQKAKPLVESTRTGGVASYSEAVKVAAPAVVNIFTTQNISPQDVPLNEQFLREFFGRDMPRQRQQTETNLGSGVIVRKDGYILTNHHVIAAADQIVVALHDGRKVQAKVIGSDPESDLAVIKVELDNLPVLPFKLSGNEVGDVVLAIGNPFGVGQTVTQGIISATDRTGLGINTYEDFIQTDAAINPGNSGGALIDVAGNLVGINTAIYSRSGGSMGIGFAIPAQVSQQVLDSILKEGRVVRGWLGIEIRNTQNSELSLDSKSGAMVMGVLPDGPADKGGLRQGDIITSVNGQAIESANQLISFIAGQKPNAEINISLLRNDEKVETKVIVAERPERKNVQFVPIPRQGAR
ncbi:MULTISPECIES: S1C family serine protease [unclassified Acinetobacter]|uniref:S1C family serine protease n=1 Tax=unclassified Acinetobacter TaxID=196816 RepID=UPI0035B8B395